MRRQKRSSSNEPSTPVKHQNNYLRMRLRRTPSNSPYSPDKYEVVGSPTQRKLRSSLRKQDSIQERISRTRFSPKNTWTSPRKHKNSPQSPISLIGTRKKESLTETPKSNSPKSIRPTRLKLHTETEMSQSHSVSTPKRSHVRHVVPEEREKLEIQNSPEGLNLTARRNMRRVQEKAAKKNRLTFPDDSKVSVSNSLKQKNSPQSPISLIETRKRKSRSETPKSNSPKLSRTTRLKLRTETEILQSPSVSTPKTRGLSRLVAPKEREELEIQNSAEGLNLTARRNMKRVQERAAKKNLSSEIVPLDEFKKITSRKRLTFPDSEVAVSNSRKVYKVPKEFDDSDLKIEKKLTRMSRPIPSDTSMVKPIENSPSRILRSTPLKGKQNTILESKNVKVSVAGPSTPRLTRTTRAKTSNVVNSPRYDTRSSSKIKPNSNSSMDWSSDDPDIVETPEVLKTFKSKVPIPKACLPKPRNVFGNKLMKCPVPCRDAEFQKIWNFMKSNLEADESSCMYISGVPGSGKTLLVKAVISALDKLAKETDSAYFKHVYINGLSLGSPDKIWKRFYLALIGKKIIISASKAFRELEKIFQKKHLPIILIIDELDQLLDRQQSIVYRLLEWSSNNYALLSFIAIFNTINLPEKVMALRNVSRLGLDRVVFTAYTHDQLGEILRHYLGNENSERLGEALKLISRKVAAVSGDARRALEISKRTLEIMDLKKISGIKAVMETFKELFSAPKIQAIECCSTLEQKILRTIATDCQSSGMDETALNRVVIHIRSTCLLEGMPWSIDQILSATIRLFASKLILLENQNPTMYKKVQLNVPIEDLNFVFNINQDINSD